MAASPVSGIDAMTELSALRSAIRAGRFRRTTSGLCHGYVQANLVIVPAALAGDFRRFCERNPGPCPIIEQTAPGQTAPESAPSADLRTDVPRYRVYQGGELLAEPLDVRRNWRDDLVSFLLGCSFNFEHALSKAGVPIRHWEEGKVVPMYVTGRECRPGGIFSGPLVVSMRPVAVELVDRVFAITARTPFSHGEPIHVGAPEVLGIADIDRPDFGEPVTVRRGEVPVFWACGVTPQAAARQARVPFLITHAPGHMFVTELSIEAASQASSPPLES